MSKPPPFLIPTTQPPFPGESKEKIQDYPSGKSEINFDKELQICNKILKKIEKKNILKTTATYQIIKK